MLKAKQFTTQSEWLDVWENPWRDVTRASLEDLIARTIERLRTRMVGLRAEVSFSFGKDAWVLWHIARIAGVAKEGFSVLTQLEYSSFRAYVNATPVDGIRFVQTRHNRRWLASNPWALFPQAREASKLYKMLWCRVQAEQAAQRNLHAVLLGRRTADGNFTGHGGEYTVGKVAMIAPIYDWTHEQIIAACHYFSVKLPPYYFWPRGFVIGTHPWFMRDLLNGSRDETWAEIWSVAPDTVRDAADYIESAKTFLVRNGQKAP